MGHTGYKYQNFRPDSFKKKAIRLRKERPNLSYKEIAQLVGCSYDSVRGACLAAGLGIRRDRPRRSVKAAYFQLRDQHPDWSAHRIAKELGVSPSSAWYVRTTHDLGYEGVVALGRAAKAAGLTLEKIKKIGGIHV